MRVTAGLPHTHRRGAAGRDDTSEESRTEEEETAGERGPRKAARPAAPKWRVAEAGDRGKEEGAAEAEEQRRSWSSGAPTAIGGVEVAQDSERP